MRFALIPGVLTLVLMLTIILPDKAQASIFGEENIALMKLVVGQIVELEKLAQAIEVAKEQEALLHSINEGVGQVVNQIEAIETILERAKGLDPKNIRRIADLTEMIEETKDLRRRAEDVIKVKIQITNQAISESALQAQTSYTMGQEMVRTGSALAQESRSASPGRAAQIAAAAQSGTMLSAGVQLQTLSKMMELQALQLELQKTQMEQQSLAQVQHRAYFEGQLSHRASTGGKGARLQ